MKITVQVAGEEITLDVTADVAIGDVYEDMTSLPGILARYHYVRDAVMADYEKFDTACKIVSSHFRWNCIEDNPKTSEWRVNAALLVDPEYLERQTRKIALASLVRRVDGALRALETKGDMLRSLGAYRRTELDVLKFS